MRYIFACLGVILLSACAIQPKHLTSSCAFKRYIIDVRTPDATGGGTVEAAGSQRSEDAVLDALRASMNAPVAAGQRRVDPAMLFLSGGSQHGAFGAGYLAGWKKRDGNLPKFAVVTGISTGAILATFAFVNQPEVTEDAYAIKNEAVLLTPLVSLKGGKPTTGGYVGIIRKGAIADLAPLRLFLSKALTDSVLQEVARGAPEQRVLRVGVVDIDTGQAVALDLVDMARRWAQVPADDMAERGRLKACYVEAIVASSSAPLAALPVFIDERMYIDGGARFGAFSHEFETILAMNAQAAAPVKPAIYLLINGDQRLDSRCGRADETKCLPPRTAANEGKPLADPPEAGGAAHGKWSFLGLALRSEEILANQVYRFSADSIAYLAKREGMTLHYVQIDPDMEQHKFMLDDPDLGKEELTCRQAHDKDKTALDPVQFYPRYMRCLIDYGRTRALPGAEAPR